MHTKTNNNVTKVNCGGVGNWIKISIAIAHKTECDSINPHLPSGQLDESISNFRGVWYTFSFLFFFVSKQ